MEQKLNNIYAYLISTLISLLHFLVLDVRFQLLLIITRTLFFLQVLVVLAFLQDQLSQLGPVQLFFLELQSDWLTNDGLLLEVANVGEEGMLKAGLQWNSVVRVEDENLLQEIDCLFRTAWVFIFEISTWCVSKLLEVLESLEVCDETLV